MSTKAQASFSVIIPFYNSSETIERALQSVHKQTLAPIQTIVIDDGSHDTKLIHLSEIYDFDLIQLDRNSGSAFARIEGAKRATGSHVALLDSDDAWLPYHLEIHHKLWLNANQEVAVIGTNMRVDAFDLDRNLQFTERWNFQNIQDINAIALMFSNPLWNSATTIDVQILKSLNYWESTIPSYAEDYELLSKFVLNGFSVHKSQIATGIYHLQENSKSRNINNIFQSRVRTSMKILNSLEIKQLQKSVLKKLLQIYAWTSYTLQYAKSNEPYEEFLYPQLGKSFLIKAGNLFLKQSIGWLIARKVLKCVSFLSPRKGMKSG